MSTFPALFQGNGGGDEGPGDVAGGVLCHGVRRVPALRGVGRWLDPQDRRCDALESLCDLVHVPAANIVAVGREVDGQAARSASAVLDGHDAAPVTLATAGMRKDQRASAHRSTTTRTTDR